MQTLYGNLSATNFHFFSPKRFFLSPEVTAITVNLGIHQWHDMSSKCQKSPGPPIHQVFFQPLSDVR